MPSPKALRLCRYHVLVFDPSVDCGFASLYVPSDNVRHTQFKTRYADDAVAVLWETNSPRAGLRATGFSWLLFFLASLTCFTYVLSHIPQVTKVSTATLVVELAKGVIGGRGAAGRKRSRSPAPSYGGGKVCILVSWPVTPVTLVTPVNRPVNYRQVKTSFVALHGRSWGL